MKRFLTLTIIFSLIISGCIKKQEIAPPELTVSPDDTVDISYITPVYFTIKGFSNEDLEEFKVETTPFVYQFDTIFAPYTHFLDRRLKVTVPQYVENAPEDSIIMITFALSDHFHKTTDTAYLHLVSGYKDVVRDTAVMEFPGGDFYYSVADCTVTGLSTNADKFDLVYATDADMHSTIASPDAPWLVDALSAQNIPYTVDDKNTTYINTSQVTFDQIDAQYLHYLDVPPHYIGNSELNGYGVDNLQIGSVIVFKTAAGLKGAAKVLDINGDFITLALIIQTNGK